MADRAAAPLRGPPTAQASQGERHEHQQQRHDAGEEIALGPHERLQARSPEAQLLVGGEPGVGVGAVLHDGHERPWRLPERAQPRVGIEEGRGQPDADARADERARATRDDRATARAARSAPGRTAATRARRRRGNSRSTGSAAPGPRRPARRAAGAALPPFVQAPEHEREPLRGQHLQVWSLVDAVERESVEQPGDDAGATCRA